MSLSWLLPRTLNIEMPVMNSAVQIQYTQALFQSLLGSGCTLPFSTVHLSVYVALTVECFKL